VSAPFRIEPLSGHDRARFNCGQADLDRYFQLQVTQDVRRHVTNCFVAIEVAREIIAGYYTLAAASIAAPDLPDDMTKRLPRYPSLPAVRIGRLAVDRHFQGRGLGSAMLADAAQRALQAAPASCTLLVDAKDEHATAFYQHHGFRSLENQPRTLFLPLATVAAIRRV
jgi:ribosomal protein S18 acetylase RimI-like enzyme